jgi:hypothetical protein
MKLDECVSMFLYYEIEEMFQKKHKSTLVGEHKKKKGFGLAAYSHGLVGKVLLKFTSIAVC